MSYDQYGSGPPLVLVHGAFSDHRTNWEHVKPLLEKKFTCFAVARRGRGKTDATEDHTVDDEAADVAEVISAADMPVFLLGHSHGGQVALASAAVVPTRVRRLVLYEPPWPQAIGDDALEELERLAQDQRWDDFAATFFAGLVSPDELEDLRVSDLWPPIVADAKASLGDLRALKNYKFEAQRFREVGAPTLLQIGTESPSELFVTDALAAVLPDCRIEELAGQAHEGMTTAPEQYADAVIRFCRGQ